MKLHCEMESESLISLKINDVMCCCSWHGEVGMLRQHSRQLCTLRCWWSRRWSLALSTCFQSGAHGTGILSHGRSKWKQIHVQQIWNTAFLETWISLECVNWGSMKRNQINLIWFVLVVKSTCMRLTMLIMPCFYWVHEASKAHRWQNIE